MIPDADVVLELVSPLPRCEMPRSDDISEEGFGYFRGTWFIGRVHVADAQRIIRDESLIMEFLDRTADTAAEFEQLATAIEAQDLDAVDEPLLSRALSSGLSEHVTDDDGDDPESLPLAGLEVGVAGLTFALSAIRCLTAASCRWHGSEHSWSDAPVVFFAAPSWRAAILAELIADEKCGMGSDRDMLTVYGRSIRDTHRLAERILAERARFLRKPVEGASTSRRKRRATHGTPDVVQFSLLGWDSIAKP